MRKTKNFKIAATLIILICVCFTGILSSCDFESVNTVTTDNTESTTLKNSETFDFTEEFDATTKNNNVTFKENSDSSANIDSEDIPAFNGKAYITLNNNVPDFTESDITKTAFESYSSLDYLGRCSVAFACLGKETMPKSERGDIGMIKPSGWKTQKYDCVDGKYLYNRCHLIGFQLSGENANSKNLITGTRFLNIKGMLPFENMVADYIKETSNHVMYRVTPVFEGENLLCKGVQIEGYSVEDNGEGICFNVFAYNAQPSVKINYKNGESYLIAETTALTQQTSNPPEEHSSEKTDKNETNKDYILNTNSKKFHKPDCSSVKNISQKNKKTFFGNKQTLLDYTYTPCKNCNP